MRLDDLRDIEAENSILRLMLAKPKLIAEVNTKLKDTDFYSLANQSIYSALIEMLDADMSIDVVSLSSYLEKTGKMENVGGIMYLTSLYNGLMHEAGLDSYIQIVKEDSIRRNLCLKCDEVTKRIHDKTMPVEDLMGNLANTLESLQPVPVVDKTTAILNAYASLTTDKCLGLSTGYDELDKLLDGLRKGNLIILAGRPAMGKTTFALNIVANLCKAGKKVVFYSLEMTQEEIYQKLITRESKISPVEAKSQVIRDKQTKNNTLFTDEVKTFKEKESRAFWTRLQLGMDDVSKWHLDILDQCNSELRDIRLSAKIQAKRKDVDLIVIDYLQLMSDKGHESRVAEVTAISKGLKNLAKELEIPILALAQLNRNVEKQTNKRPTKADLRESGSIEQDADKIILIYRDDYYAKNGKPYTELIVDKTRMGKNGTALVEFFPAISRFEDYKGKL